LLALIALVLLLTVGYAVRAARSDDPPHPTPVPSRSS
jgi:hypothetical protein